MNKRTILFIVLSILIWIVYINFVMPLFIKPQKGKPVVSQPGSTQTTSQTGEPTHPITPTGQSIVEPTALTPTAILEEELPLQPDHTISNPHFSAFFTNKGAALKSLILSEYQTAGKKDKLILLNTFEPDKLSLTIKTSQDLSISNWKIISPTNEQQVTFQKQTVEGLTITKQFSCLPDKYILSYRVSVKNNHPEKQPVKTTIRFNGFAGINPEIPDHTDIKGVRAYREKENKWVVKEDIDINGLKRLEGKYNIPKDVKVIWTGLINKYFASVLIPADILTENALVDYGFELLNDNICFSQEIERRKETGEILNPQVESGIKAWAGSNMQCYVQSKEITVAPHQEVNYEFIAFIGPKSAKTLVQLQDKGVDRLISYGWFGFISVILLGILKFFHSIFGNYGWAIIFLTILVKALLFPISRKGQVSMYKMQQIQPKIKALQAKYKNDKQKLGAEQLKLFKEYGVNPLSGCFPMLFQIPVFIGLYWALYLAIELRQAPFMFWITDLSQPDKLCKLPFSILGATDLHLLPLLMTASWLIQSLTQPKSPDPQARSQQKLFTFMPLLFLLLFYNVPAGLTLYWFVQTALSIVEQQIIKRTYFKP